MILSELLYGLEVCLSLQGKNIVGENSKMRSFIIFTFYKITRVNKSTRMLWAGLIALMRNMRNADKFFVGNSK
jgi:hypothetical protein